MYSEYAHRIARYRARFMEEYLQRMNLNNPDAMYLVKIYHAGSAKMCSIVADAPFHKSHATRSISRLVKFRLVDKEPDPDDLRGFLVRVTPSGEKVAGSVLEGFTAWDRLITGMLTKDEHDLLLTIYKKIHTALQIYFKEDPLNEKDV
jgi:DNA-binding MarR family transcriptional regulator